MKSTEPMHTVSQPEIAAPSVGSTPLLAFGCVLLCFCVLGHSVKVERSISYQSNKSGEYLGSHGCDWFSVKFVQIVVFKHLRDDLEIRHASV